MTPQQLIDTLSNLKIQSTALLAASVSFDGLVQKVSRKINRTDPLDSPLSQVDTDHIVQIYTPLYTTAIRDIKTAATNLGITIP